VWSFLGFDLQSCKDKMEFECNGWTSKDALAQGAFDMVDHVGSDGVSRLVRIPSGRAREMVGKSVQDGSLEAKDGIRWQDKKVPPKIQLGLVLDQLETLLRCFHFFLSTLIFRLYVTVS
jgi:DnaJ family protein C protein 13